MRMRASNFLKHCFDAGEFIGQHSLEQIKLAGKMRVERFLANAQFLRQIVHGHTAESVTEEVDPRRIDDSLPVRIALSAARPRFWGCFHIQWYSYHNAETNPVYLVSTGGDLSCRAKSRNLLNLLVLQIIRDSSTALRCARNDNA